MNGILRRTVAAVAGAGVMFGAAAATAGAHQPLPASAEATTLTISVPSDVSSWDPAIGAGATSLGYLQAVYSSVTTLSSDLSVGPGLATDWTYDDTRTTLTMTIRDDVVFSDGNPADAEAIKANLDRGIATPGSTSSALASIDSVTAESPTELVITLTEPDPGLLYNLGFVPGMIASPAAFDTLTTRPVGSGPYVLDHDATTPGASYTFARSETFSQETVYGFDTITMVPLPDTNAMINAVTTGQVDAGGVPATAFADVEAAGLAYHETTGLILGMWIVDREGTIAPELTDVRVRQAINHALDAEGILAAVDEGHGERRTQMFMAGSPAYDADLNDRYPYDPDLARELLAEAGYPDGFTLSLPSENAYVPALYPIVAQQLGDVGIDVEFTPVSTNQITQQYLAGTFPAFMFTYTATQNWIDASLFLAEGGVFNPFHVADPTVTDLMSRIAVADDDEAEPLWQELNTYVVEEAWFAPLYASTNLLVWDPEVVQVNVDDDQLFAYLPDYQPA